MRLAQRTCSDSSPDLAPVTGQRQSPGNARRQARMRDCISLRLVLQALGPYENVPLHLHKR